MSPQIITLGQLPRVKVNNSTESGVGASLAKHALQFSTSVERRSDGVSQPSRTNVLFMGADIIRPEQHARFKWPLLASWWENGDGRLTLGGNRYSQICLIRHLNTVTSDQYHT